MRAPQIILATLFVLNVAIGLFELGATKDKQAFCIKLVSTAITFSLLWWGGFWK